MLCHKLRGKWILCTAQLSHILLLELGVSTSQEYKDIFGTETLDLDPVFH